MRPLGLLREGRVVGRGCMALLMPVVYTGRALPLAWLGRQGQKGPLPADLHSALGAQGQELIPLGASVVLRGDGAFDGQSCNTRWRRRGGPPCAVQEAM